MRPPRWVRHEMPVAAGASQQEQEWALAAAQRQRLVDGHVNGGEALVGHQMLCGPINVEEELR
jgi:hypothetical protein